MTPRQALVLWRVSLRLAGGFVSLAGVASLMSPARRERMVVRWCRGALADLGIELEVCGEPVPAGACLVVSNHVSWIDTVALRAVVPCGFVAKRSLRGWPVVGRLIALTGGVFVRRESPADLPGALAAIADRLAAGAPVCIFPEGTTTIGASVAPFFPSVFSAAASRAIPVLPVALRYFEGNTPSPAMAWVGDEAFLPSLLRIANAARPRVRVSVGAPFPPPADRKQAALRARASVLGLAELPPAASAFEHPPGGRIAPPAGRGALAAFALEHARAWIIRERGCGAAAPEPDSILGTLGVDSLDVVAMLSELEALLGIPIDGAALHLPLEPTLQEFAAAIAAAVPPAAGSAEAMAQAR